jgi:D-lyxose ketol-isomerase
MERVFSTGGILTNLCQFWIGAKNLDVLVLLIKNWHDDPTTNIGFANLDRFNEVEEDILDVIDFEFPC